MQPINFIKTVSLKKYTTTRVWLMCSILLLILCMISLTIMHYQQRALYQQLLYEKNFFVKKITALDTIAHHASAKKEEHKNMYDKLQTIAAYDQHLHNHLQFLSTLAHTLHNGVCLQSMNIHGQSIEFKIVADTSESIFKACDTISAQAHMMLSIVGLELDNHKVLATFKADTKKV